METNHIFNTTGKELKTALARHEHGAVILLELPAEHYCEENLSSVSVLTTSGYEGVYVSFNRPFANISSLLEWHGIDVRSLFIVDGATALGGEKGENNPRCIALSETMDITEMVGAICTALSKVKGKKKFVFIDSLTTMGLYKPVADMKKFSEMLVRAVKKRSKEDVTFLFNVAKDQSQQQFIDDMDPYTDEFLHLGHCT